MRVSKKVHFIRGAVRQSCEGSARLISAILIAMIANGCASLPGQGPNASEITSVMGIGDTAIEPPYVIAGLSSGIVNAIGAMPTEVFSAALPVGPRQPGAVRIGIGDVLGIQIWETSPDGLFSTPNSKTAEIAATVNGQGEIYLPYVGKLSAGGQSVEELRSNIAQALVGKAVDPEVVVDVKDNGAQSITVVGDVKSAGRYNLPASGLRLLDAVAISGGPSQAGFDTEISVIRGGRTAVIRLDNVLRSSTENIWLVPQDTIQLRHQPRSFTVFGAVSERRQQVFRTSTVSLTEALAQAGGLNDNLADAGGVFLFRFESSARLISAGINVPQTLISVNGVPTIFQLNLNSPQSYFLAQSFEMQDKDILYVATAPASEFRKFVQFIVAPFVATTDAVGSL